MNSQNNASEILVTSLKEVRDAAVKTLNGEMPIEGDRWIVLKAWWERVGKRYYREASKDTDSTELLDSIEKVFPGISKIILCTLTIKIDDKQFAVEKAGLHNPKNEDTEIDVPVYEYGHVDQEGLDWIYSGFYEGSDYELRLVGSYEGGKTETLSFDYESPMMIQILDTIDPE